MNMPFPLRYPSNVPLSASTNTSCEVSQSHRTSAVGPALKSPQRIKSRISLTMRSFSSGCSAAHLLTQKPRWVKSRNISPLAPTRIGCRLIAPYVTMHAPGLRIRDMASASLPPTQFKPSRTGSLPPLVHSCTCFANSGVRTSSAVTTCVAPRSRSSFWSAAPASPSLPRTIATLGMPQRLANCSTALPTALLAPFSTTQLLPLSPSSARNSTNPSNNRHAVTGFTVTAATCAGVKPVGSTRTTVLSSTWACVRHVPSPTPRGVTQSPRFTVLACPPAARTSKHPSLPGTVPGRGVGEGVGEEEAEDKEGWEGEG